jgi:hypothetical protein
VDQTPTPQTPTKNIIWQILTGGKYTAHKKQLPNCEGKIAKTGKNTAAACSLHLHSSL